MMELNRLRHQSTAKNRWRFIRRSREDGIGWPENYRINEMTKQAGQSLRSRQPPTSTRHDRHDFPVLTGPFDWIRPQGKVAAHADAALPRVSSTCVRTQSSRDMTMWRTCLASVLRSILSPPTLTAATTRHF
nr:hypothetical protein CFP56_33524 [Quercus suber]